MKKSFKYKYEKYLNKLSGGSEQLKQKIDILLTNFFKFKTYHTEYLFAKTSRRMKKDKYPFFINVNTQSDYFRSSNNLGKRCFEIIKSYKNYTEIENIIKNYKISYCNKDILDYSVFHEFGIEPDVYNVLKCEYNQHGKTIDIIENKEELNIKLHELSEKVIRLIDNDNVYTVIISNLINNLIRIYDENKNKSKWDNFEVECISLIIKIIDSNNIFDDGIFGSTRYLFINDILFVLLSYINPYNYTDYKICETNFYKLKHNENKIIDFIPCSYALSANSIIVSCLFYTFGGCSEGLQFYKSSNPIFQASNMSVVYFEYSDIVCKCQRTELANICIYIGGFSSESDINYVRNKRRFNVKNNVLSVQDTYDEKKDPEHDSDSSLFSKIKKDLDNNNIVALLIDTTLDIYDKETNPNMNFLNVLYEKSQQYINNKNFILHIVKSHQKFTLCGTGKFMLGSIGTICNRENIKYIENLNQFGKYFFDKYNEPIQTMIHNLNTKSDKIYLDYILKISKCIMMAYNSDKIIANGPFIYMKIYDEESTFNDKLLQFVNKSETFGSVESTVVMHNFFAPQSYRRISIGCECIENPKFFDDLIKNMYPEIYEKSKFRVFKCLCYIDKKCNRMTDLLREKDFEHIQNYQNAEFVKRLYDKKYYDPETKYYNIFQYAYSLFIKYNYNGDEYYELYNLFQRRRQRYEISELQEIYNKIKDKFNEYYKKSIQDTEREDEIKQFELDMYKDNIFQYIMDTSKNIYSESLWDIEKNPDRVVDIINLMKGGILIPKENFSKYY